MTYGDNNRLIDVDGFTYGYNPMQQRVIDNGKINNYDLNGQLISVNDGNNIIEYIYLGNAKIAMLVDDSIDLKTYYSHNNYMNMPRLFTDEYKNVVWSGDFTPFGELYNEYGSVNSVMRFAGQYKNVESGYFYNYHRDYDAGLGRYLQSDPIGLNGGINTYAYVNGNPINFVDPLGLRGKRNTNIYNKIKKSLENYNKNINNNLNNVNKSWYIFIDNLSRKKYTPVNNRCAIGALNCLLYGDNNPDFDKKKSIPEKLDNRSIQEIDCALCNLNCKMAVALGTPFPTSLKNIGISYGATTLTCPKMCKEKCKENKGEQCEN